MESSSYISVAIKQHPLQALSTALSKLPCPIAVKPSTRKIIIKPSVYDTSLPGNTTRLMVAAAVQVFGHIAPISIVESDNPKRSADDAFRALGYTTLSGSNVSLVNLSLAPTRLVTFPGHFFKEHAMPELISPDSFLINIPTLKAEPDVCVVGGGLKNLFGLLPEQDKSVYHQDIDNVLVDLVSLYRPALTIMDLTDVVIGDRASKLSKRIGGVIVSEDPVAVDAFCADLLGIDPMEVPHIKKAYDLGLGEALPERIKVLGTAHQISSLKAAFQN
jgi:uncharacterized protein (DUF362 family)